MDRAVALNHRERHPLESARIRSARVVTGAQLARGEARWTEGLIPATTRPMPSSMKRLLGLTVAAAGIFGAIALAPGLGATFEEAQYVAFSAPVTLPAAGSCLLCGAREIVRSEPVSTASTQLDVEFFASGILAPPKGRCKGDDVRVMLYQQSVLGPSSLSLAAPVGTLGHLRLNCSGGPVLLRTRLVPNSPVVTPPAAELVYSVRASASLGATVEAGDGGVVNFEPQPLNGFLRISASA